MTELIESCDTNKKSIHVNWTLNIKVFFFFLGRLVIFVWLVEWLPSGVELFDGGRMVQVLD